MHWASESFCISPCCPVFPSLPEPVSQLQADFTLRDGNSGPTAELSCLASSGSPPIIYRLIGNGGRIHAQQRPLHGKPANFSIPLSQTFGWFRCEAANGVSVESSARVLLPPGEKALPDPGWGLQQGGQGWGRAGPGHCPGHDGPEDAACLLCPWPSRIPTYTPSHPTGELPLTPTCILAGSLVSIAAISYGMLRSTR